MKESVDFQRTIGNCVPATDELLANDPLHCVCSLHSIELIGTEKNR